MRRLVSVCVCVLGLMVGQRAAALDYYRFSTDWRFFIGHPIGDPWIALTSVDDGLFNMSDQVGFAAVPPVGFDPFNGGGVAFFTVADLADPGSTMLVTTVYGIDITPEAPLVSLTGFTAADPELVPTSVETITSRFGTSYSSDTHLTVPLSDIGSILPGHDLSTFANGDSNSILYVFQTYAPLGEFLAVPEPTAITLLGSALLLFGGHRSRRA